jgi:hypothetical protein
MILYPERVLFERPITLEIVVIVIGLGVVFMGERFAILVVGQTMHFLFGS